ncbi:sigma factor-like helix-turn-helix DNA-binding protein [Fredinandcohnia humi]
MSKFEIILFAKQQEKELLGFYMITREDVLYYLEMRTKEKTHEKKRYYKIIKDRESQEYKKFINVYLETKSVLSDREQVIMDSIYGVSGKPMKLKEVGEMIGLTPERIRQLIYKSERKITTALCRKFKIKFIS